MGRNITNIYTCDVCRKVISPGRVVEIREYGLAFHPKCFTETSGAKMVRLMGCDETTVANYDEQGHPTSLMLRVRKPEVIQADGTVVGPLEPVNW